jgi:hypothetical protein
VIAFQFPPNYIREYYSLIILEEDCRLGMLILVQKPGYRLPSGPEFEALLKDLLKNVVNRDVNGRRDYKNDIWELGLFNKELSYKLTKATDRKIQVYMLDEILQEDSHFMNKWGPEKEQYIEIFNEEGDLSSLIVLNHTSFAYIVDHDLFRAKRLMQENLLLRSKQESRKKVELGYYAGLEISDVSLLIVQI